MNWLLRCLPSSVVGCLILLTGFGALAGEIRTSVDSNQDLAYRRIPGASAVPLPARPIDPVELQAFLDGVMASEMAARHLAGGTVSVVKDGKLLFAKGYGYADVEKRIPVKVDQTLFRPGSISKLFTWTAVMQLVGEGKLDLDADVNTYLTQFKIPATFSEPITLRNILTHTAGFEDGGLGYLIIADSKDLVPLADSLKKHMPARVFPPGQVGAYSNYAVALAGLIIANVSGIPFDDYVEQHIFVPLGMLHSSFREPLPNSIANDMSEGYKYESGKYKAIGFEYLHNFGPAGSLASTATDMAKFMIAQLQDGEYQGQHILTEDMAERMHARNFSPNPYVNGAGWGIYETYINGRRIIGHGGSTSAFKSLLSLIPSENTGIFVSFNTAAGTFGSMDVVQAFMDHYFPANLPKVTPPADAAEHISRYAGTYHSTRNSYTKAEKILGGLTEIKVAPTGHGSFIISNMVSPPSEWVEARTDVLRKADSDWTIAFEGNDGGPASRIVGPWSFLSAERIAWYETLNFQASIFLIGGLLFIVAIVGAVRRFRAEASLGSPLRWTRPVAGIIGALDLMFMVVLVITFTMNTDELYYGYPAIFKAGLILPLLSIPVTAVTLFFAIHLWCRKTWSIWQRSLYSAIALAGLLFLWSLNYWNLIGYHFG